MRSLVLLSESAETFQHLQQQFQRGGGRFHKSGLCGLTWPARARQALPSTLMETSETVFFQESVLQAVQQRRPCKEHSPLAKDVQTDPSTDVHATHSHGHQAHRE